MNETNYQNPPTPQTRRRTIGGTTYIIISEFSPDARETAVEKMRRIILKEAEKVS